MVNRPREFLSLLLLTGVNLFAAKSEAIPFSDHWQFLRADEPRAASASFDDATWETVALPHTAQVEALPAGKNAPQWQGICWYRKTFDLLQEAAGKSILLRLDGAMNAAEIWVNGKSAGKFMGGYLPYIVDISALANPGGKNVVAVRLDNRDNPCDRPQATRRFGLQPLRRAVSQSPPHHQGQAAHHRTDARGQSRWRWRVRDVS